MELNYKEKLKEIELFCFDVDGVFTDNIVYLTADGAQMRTANVRDGYAVQLAVKKGIRIAIISGGKNEAVRTRFEALGVQEIHLAVSDKPVVFEALLSKYKTTADKVCYMGDDIPDYHIMSKVGLAVCPADAAHEIRQIAHYISPKGGGQGCVRDVLEQTLKIRNSWMDQDGHVW